MARAPDSYSESFQRGSNGSRERLACVPEVCGAEVCGAEVCGATAVVFRPCPAPGEIERVVFRALNCAGHVVLPYRTCDFTIVRGEFLCQISIRFLPFVVCGKS